MPEQFDPTYWESRYAAHDRHSHGGPNPHLVTEVSTLAPGAVLEAGCGEGESVLWLAEHGWEVTAVDVSATALRRARERAEGHDAAMAARIRWVEADLTVWESPPAAFDLVTAHYVHPTGPPGDLLLRLAAGVSAGGTLLYVDHDHSDEHAHAHSSPAQLANLLAPDRWEVQVAETRHRDAVLRARRLA